MIKQLGRATRAIYEHCFVYLSFLYFGVCGVLYGAISIVLHVLLPRRLGARLGKRTINLLFRGFLAMLRASGVVKLDLSALDALRNQSGLLIAPNHPCMLDAVFIIAHMPNVACIMKAEIWDNVVLGGGARLAGYIRNDAPLSMVRLAAQELCEGRPLLVFPEGTRTRQAPINEFKGGFALIAKRARAPIQTVFLETNSPFLGKGWPLLKMPTFPLVYRARLGKRFMVEGDVKTFMLELEDYYRQELTGPSLSRPAAVVHRTSAPHPGQPA